MKLMPLAAALLGALPVHAAEVTWRADDLRRLEQLDAASGQALREAFAKGAPADVADLVEALRGPADNSGAEALAGDWTCRTFKLGGDLGLVAYPPFKCRGTPAEDGVMFEKLTGSQRVRGLVQRGPDGALLLAGVGYIAGDTPPEYGALPAEIDPAASPQILAAPGVVEVTGGGSARILFPLPMVESTLDILQLSR
ncbi:DUF4893 domain-containing protein [Paracoccus suum]|uniref:DUF4893 domain-containing protein n=1 Tax=Paracoccus suum TaxID=2259340 RepID=A0A344PJE9_9RHOB|nr:DUF4893 domain-containing protein [Paracoccus suum]AXC49504.1 DUF4893 domain-containing protein [Paracoccus suum]